MRQKLARFLHARLLPWLFPDRVPEVGAAWLRRHGARVGRGCAILGAEVLTEPYLLEIGDRVAVSVGTRFVTHDGSTFHGTEKETFGRISVGDDTFIGCYCLILPGTVIGRDCIVGAGSVVRGTVPDGSVVMGNPARFVMTTAMARRLGARNRNSLTVKGLSPRERQRTVLEHFGPGPGE